MNAKSIDSHGILFIPVELCIALMRWWICSVTRGGKVLASMSRLFQLLVRIAVMLMLVVPAYAHAAPMAQRCFDVPAIDDCIASGNFETYWAANGGLPVFGYPITPDRPERNADLDELFVTQWFERNRFEEHPEDRPPYHIQLGRLGAELLAAQGRGFEGVPPGTRPQGRCRTFDTGGKPQSVCDPFLRYWETHGLEFDGKAGTAYAESLALFGLPLTYPKRETNPNGDTVVTQWFERARFEDHGAKGVLLGLLGHETLARRQPIGAVVPILDGDTGFLLGGARGTAWVDDETTALALRGDERYRLYGLDGAPTTTRGARPGLVGAPCTNTIFVNMEPKSTTLGTIAVGGDWDARPRTITSLSTEMAVYRDAIAAILRGHGISQPDVRLTRVLRVDLEGDGIDEVLISATRMAAGMITPSVTSGDYSLVVLRRLSGSTVQTLLLAGEFYPEPAEFVAPNAHTIANVLDLNGDGRMEVVLDSTYYEGAATAVLDIVRGQPQVVLDTGCGA